MSAGASDFNATFAELYDRYLVPMTFLPHARRLADCVVHRDRCTPAGVGEGLCRI